MPESNGVLQSYTFSPQFTISAIDLAAILVGSGSLLNVPESFVRALPFDTARHFQPIATAGDPAQPKLLLD